MPPGIDLVVFDMDGVLARLDHGRRLEMLGAMTGREAPFLVSAIWESDFEPSAEAGAYPTGAEYLAEWNHRIGGAMTREQWIRMRRDAMTIDHEMLALVEAVGRTCGIAMLSNNNALLLECLPEIAPDVLRVFGERAHASYQFGARKPDSEVFLRLLARYGVAPARAVFVDDYEHFVAGARRAGLHGIHYRDLSDLRTRLGALGVSLGEGIGGRTR